MSTGKEMQQLREQLEQQALQTRQALSQLMLVREQLISETNARIEAQVRWMFFFFFLWIFRHMVTITIFTKNIALFIVIYWIEQARTQQLLQQNRELLEHLASLGGYNENERTGLTSANIGLAPQVRLECFELMQCFYVFLCFAVIDWSNRFPYANAKI